MTTGQLIRAERRKAGMTQAELAEKSSEIVFHGLTARWRDAVGLYGSPTCSNCGSGAALRTRFCPHCGAKMEDVT